MVLTNYIAIKKVKTYIYIYIYICINCLCLITSRGEKCCHHAKAIVQWLNLFVYFPYFPFSFFYFRHLFVNILRNYYFYKFIFETLKRSFVNPDKINNGTVLVAMELRHSQLLKPDKKLSLHWL